MRSNPAAIRPDRDGNAVLNVAFSVVLAVMLAVVLPSCTSTAFLVANARVSFGPYERITDQRYGPEDNHKLDIYIPSQSSEDLRPVVVFFHGGSWASGNKGQYRFAGAALAEEGIIGVIPNYGLFPTVRFPGFVDDAAQAVAWTLAHAKEFGGDPRRVFVAGHSAGAHIAMLLTLDDHYLQAVDSSPRALRGAIGISGPYDFKIDSDFLRGVFGGTEDSSITQPIHFARGDAPPILLLHGTEDAICLVQHAKNLDAAIRGAGGSVELRLYEGVGHADTLAALSPLRRTRAPTLYDIAAFVDSH